jgi:hypothetical protein
MGGKSKSKPQKRATPARVAARLDALYAELPRLECKGLCAHSCVPIELAPEERNRIRREHCVEIPAPSKLIADGCRKCVALEDRRCTVYEVRPMICRLWGIDETMPCPHGCKPAGGWLSRLESHRFMLRTFLIAGWPPGYPKLTPKQVSEHLRSDEARAMAEELAAQARPELPPRPARRPLNPLRRWGRGATLTLVAMLLAAGASLSAAGPARATFPGRSGEIAFLCLNDNRVLNVCAVRPAGGEPRFVSGLAGGFRSGPRWSPNARRVLYQYEDPSFGIMSAPGLRPIPLTPRHGQPAWSPRGDRIALVEAPDSTRPKGIFTVDLSGRNRTRVVANGTQPDWSPDGRTLAYQAGRDIWLYDFRLRRARRLTRSPAGSASRFPSWSPDGRSLAFSRRSGSVASATENIFTITLSGRDRQLTHSSARGADIGDSDPSWSPDGRSIAFVHAPDNAGYTLAVIGTDGANQRQLVGPPMFNAFAPDWGRPRR